MSHSFAVPIVEALLRYASARSVARPLILGHAGLREHDIADPAGRVPAEAVYRLLTHLAREVQEDGLPLRLAELLSTEDLDVVGDALSTSTSALESVHQAARLTALLFDDGRFEVTEAARMIEVRWLAPFPTSVGERLYHELAVAVFLRQVRSSVSRDIPAAAVRFCHPGPQDLREHHRFFRSPVEYRAPITSFTLRRGDLEGVVPERADAALNRFFIRYADDLLEARSATETGRSLAARVRDVVGPALPNQDASSRFVAKRLGISERSLRRQLAAEGESFRGLVDEVRREKAESMLSDSDTPIGEIALLLGFSDTSAFSRAFRRWCGISPQRFRDAG